MTSRRPAILLLLYTLSPVLEAPAGDLWLGIGSGGRRMISTDG